MVKFQVSAGRISYVDFDTAAEAIAVVENEGSGQVIKFIGTRNAPGYLPEIVYNSVGLWTYENGKWFEFSIYTGAAVRLDEEKPH